MITGLFPRIRWAGPKVGVPMGDKSPKNARKNVKQKSDAKTAKDNKKQEALPPTLEHPAAR
ncbi:MAG: hypothetical protein ABI577_03710 [bacterium]